MAYISKANNYQTADASPLDNKTRRKFLERPAGINSPDPDLYLYDIDMPMRYIPMIVAVEDARTAQEQADGTAPYSQTFQLKGGLTNTHWSIFGAIPVTAPTIEPIAYSDAVSAAVKSTLKTGQAYRIHTRPQYSAGLQGDIIIKAKAPNQLEKTGLLAAFNPDYSLFPIFFDRKDYAKGDRVIWGGFTYEAKTAITYDGTNLLQPPNYDRNRWLSIPNSAYVEDEVDYVLQHDWIERRKDANGNEVTCYRDEAQVVVSNPWNQAVNLFQWGSPIAKNNKILSPAYVDCLNWPTTGLKFYNNECSGQTQFEAMATITSVISNTKLINAKLSSYAVIDKLIHSTIINSSISGQTGSQINTIVHGTIIHSILENAISLSYNSIVNRVSTAIQNTFDHEITANGIITYKSFWATNGLRIYSASKTITTVTGQLSVALVLNKRMRVENYSSQNITLEHCSKGFGNFRMKEGRNLVVPPRHWVDFTIINQGVNQHAATWLEDGRSFNMFFKGEISSELHDDDHTLATIREFEANLNQGDSWNLTVHTDANITLSGGETDVLYRLSILSNGVGGKSIRLLNLKGAETLTLKPKANEQEHLLIRRIKGSYFLVSRLSE